MQRKRLALDVTTLVWSKGAISGIGRVVYELAAWAASHRDGIQMVFYDSENETFLRLREEWTELLWQGLADVDTSQRRRHTGPIRLSDRLSPPFRQIAQWLHTPRRRAMVALERWRLLTQSETARGWINWLQSFVLSKRLRREIWDAQGRRRSIIPFSMAFDPDYTLSNNDVLIIAGAPWTSIRPKRISEFKEQHGIELVFLSHDIIPLLFPRLYVDRVVEEFRDFIHSIVSVADLIIYNSDCSQKDMRAYCEANHLPIGKTRVMRFGAKLLPPGEDLGRPLPCELERDQYALFVSFFDLRKGHALLFSVWKRLLKLGIPQAHRFKMVFVGFGEAGNSLLEQMEAHPSAGETLIILKGVSDLQLAELYRNAAFCVFPSLYEGYGLPVIESFAYGKAVIASTGGALPEVIGDFSPCLDPLDEEAWFDTLKLWIEQPAAREQYEAAIRNEFRPTTWSEAAEDFFRLIDIELCSAR